MQKKLFLGGIIAILLVAIPVTMYLLGQPQETQTHATAATTLSMTLTNSSAQVTAGQDFSVDVNINPANSTPGNQVSIVYATINYDSTKVSTATAGFTPSSSFPTILEGPTYSSGIIRVGLSIGADYTKAVQTAGKVGTISFRALSSTNGNPAQIASFDTNSQKTFVYSIASATDGTSENVLMPNPSPLSITIANAVAGPTTIPQLPICSNLKIDRVASGTAPFSITFTADGSDPDGTISKVSFDFGDGPNTDVAVGGGIGTSTVSVSTAHTYTNPGTFAAVATIYDNNQNKSAAASACSKTITVTQAAIPTPLPTGSGGGKGGTPTPAASTPTPIVANPTIIVVTPTHIVAVPTSVTTNPTIAPTGPEDIILTFGGIGVILSVIGAILFFAL